ncbi:hypothetical protein RKD45_004656 [Streptomyces griseus]
MLRLRDALVTAVRDGELPEERLADAAARVRALASWTQGVRGAASGPGADEQEGTAPGAGAGVGLVAARRAVTVTGTAGPLDGPAYVAAFTPVANIAVGDETPWGVAAELSRILPGTETGTYGSGSVAPAAEVLRAAGERRIVAVVRDVHRHGWMSAALDEVLRARPDTVVVEMGLPVAPPRGALHVATHGAARVCGVAAAEAITGTGV